MLLSGLGKSAFFWLMQEIEYLPHAGVLILRLEDFDSTQKVDVVRKIIQGYQTKIIGKFCVFKDNKLRVR